MSSKFSLNRQQVEAVKYISGPCLVIAGAGSGKTRVITEKIIHLINNCNYKPYEICAVTFTNKAAKEMRDRVSSSIRAELLKGMLVTTFHSLGLHIIRKEYKRLGLKKDFILFDERDQRQLITNIIREFSKTQEDPTDEEINNFLTFISNCKMKGIEAERSYENSTATDKLNALIYIQYEKMLKSYSALDFDDLILKPMLLFKSNINALQFWQRKLLYILVDEYQDTNQTQYEFIKLLVGERQRFTFVGDDDQSIYGWRGAQPENINQLVSDFPSIKVIKLEQNYRSLGRILHCANVLIENNNHLFNKKLYSSFEYGDPIIVHENQNPVKEAEYIATEITANRFLKSANWSDFAILYRTNYNSREIERYFKENHIPYRINGDISFFERAEVKDILSYYRVLVNPNDDNALLRIINVPHREIGTISTEKLGNFSRKHQISLYEAIDYPALRDEMNDKTYSSMVEFKDFIEECRYKIENGEAIEVVNDLFMNIEYRNYLLNSNKDEKIANIKYDNICTLKSWIIDKLKGKSKEGIDPVSFNEAVRSVCIREMLDQNENENEYDLDQIQLMTLHSSKGLEFPFVYIISCEENIIPHKNSIETGNIDEERRLFYVGITRAKKNLVLSYTSSRASLGSKTCENAKYSRFIDELPQEDLSFETIKNPKKIDRQETLKKFDQLKELLK
jgi:ATP-dependent DNA helicase Rep